VLVHGPQHAGALPEVSRTLKSNSVMRLSNYACWFMGLNMQARYQK
jgi:hypothetical protein